jgi:hypothetical protein
MAAHATIPLGLGLLCLLAVSVLQLRCAYAQVPSNNAGANAQNATASNETVLYQVDVPLVSRVAHATGTEGPGGSWLIIGYRDGALLPPPKPFKSSPLFFTCFWAMG